MSCQVIPKAWPSRVVRGSIKLRIPASLLGSMSSFVPTPDVCFFSDFAEIILQECFQVRRPCVWIHGIPFEAKTEAVFLLILSSMSETLVVCPVVRTLTLGGSTSMTVWFALRRVLFETILGSESAQKVVFLRFGELPESEFSN